MAQVSDSERLRRAGAGDEQALEVLVERYRDWVTALAYRLTGNRDDALDVLQETFIVLFSKIPGLVLSSSLRSFLYPVVKHQSIDVLRRRRKLMPLSSGGAEGV